MSSFSFNSTFSIDGQMVGAGCPVFFIAEAGVAHFGSLGKARQLVDLAVESGADAVKFQIFKADQLFSSESEEWKKRMKSRELPYEAFREIQSYCMERDILFLATAHDEQSFDFLVTLNVPAYKIGSGEVTNLAYIQKIAETNRPVILSSGMYTLEEIGRALDVIGGTGNRDVAVLHCVTSYPTPPPEVNLKAMDTIHETYNVITGYSDHTDGIHFPLAAAARGAKVIEKHISLDFNVPDAQDWKVSCGPDDLPRLIKQIREIEAGIGSGVKVPGISEKASIQWARKSIVAAIDIMEGEVITSEKICAKRPGKGIIPTKINSILGKKAKKNIKKDTLLKWEQIV